MEESIEEIVARINKKYQDKLIDGKCEVCGATVKYMQGEKEILCNSCQDQKETHKRRLKYLDYLLPLGYKNMSFATFDKARTKDVKNIDVALGVAQRFVEDDTGVYLYGAAGQGKTHLLVSALRDCVMQGKSVKLLRYSSELKNYKEKGLKKEDFFDEYSKCECLFIDDFGSVGSKDDAIDILYGILQKRIENKVGKKIFVTANISISKIDDDRVKSRVIGMCTGYMCHDNGVDTDKYINVIELKGNDIRLEGRL
jgi:DNA replication protein DnaC